MTNAARHFIVALMGTQTATPKVIIREVAAGSCAHTLSRTEAWAYATKLAQPTNYTRAANRPNHGLLNLTFVGLDLSERDLGPAEAPKAKAEAPGLKTFKGGCTDKQLGFVQKLRAERAMDALTERPTFEQARTMIDTLTKQAKAEKPSTPAPTAPATVADGHYALRNEDGVVKFYKVENGKEGTRWAGYTFLKAQASDDLWPIKNRDERERILGVITADAKAAMLLYGTQIGRCGHCNRTLTDEQSRADGIGPVCKANLGW